MRVGASVIIKNGLAVQSYGWDTLRPLGVLGSVLSSLDEYECDEISVLRYARGQQSQTYFDVDTECLKNCVTSSPISFGGGIKTQKDLDVIRELPIERLVFSSAAIGGNFNLIEMAARQFGRQAIQCLLPVCYHSKGSFVFLSSEERYVEMGVIDFYELGQICNEVIIYDVKSDGFEDQFIFDIIKEIPISKNRLVLSGGIGVNAICRANIEGFASVLVDNRILHKENSIIGLKKHAGL